MFDRIRAEAADPERLVVLLIDEVGGQLTHPSPHHPPDVYLYLHTFGATSRVYFDHDVI
jgi:hypothetical protein